MDRFKDKVAIVTGGASGIGRALCEALGRRGARVVVADIDEAGARRVADAMAAGGGRGQAVGLDVRKAEAVAERVRETAEEHGRLDYMFNNAGIANLGEARDMTSEQWRRIIDINLMGVLHGTTAAYERMVAQGFGHIINTASQAGLYPVAGTVSYAMTKHAVVGLSTSLRAEGAALGVRVSVVCPGPVESRIVDSATLVSSFRENIFKKVPPFMLMKADLAAGKILDGVARNRAIIIFPFHARFLWWLHRMHPEIAVYIARQGIRAFRLYRTDA